jgi:hypothetical protein
VGACTKVHPHLSVLALCDLCCYRGSLVIPQVERRWIWELKLFPLRWMYLCRTYSIKCRWFIPDSSHPLFSMISWINLICFGTEWFKWFPDMGLTNRSS